MRSVYRMLLSCLEPIGTSTNCVSKLRCTGLSMLACGVLAATGQLGAADLTPQIEQMQAAIKEGDLATTRSLLDQGFDPNVKTKDFSGPLFSAIKQKQPDIVSLLISRGADVNAVEKPQSNDSALHLAAGQGTEQIVRMLLENGALIDPLNSQEQTPLFTAIAARAPVNVANTLIEYGTNVNRANKVDLTPLEFAAKSGSGDFFEPLKAAGAIMRIAQVAKSMCGMCHSQNGPGITHLGDGPHLAGQHASYLSKQLIDYRENRRQNNRMDYAVKKN